MADAMWGIKHSCPKCGARFYDMKKPAPLTCPGCGQQFTPEAAMKSDGHRKPAEAVVAVKDELEAADLDPDIDTDIDPDIDIDDGAILEDEIDDDDDVVGVIDNDSDEHS